jgi:hypothetical protein
MNWAYQRTNPFDNGTPSLRDCWNRSTTLIAKLKAEFEQAGIVDRVRTVYVAGSLGRMEAVPSSDCDIVVVLSEHDRASNSGEDVVAAVFDCVSRTGFQRPKMEGIFGSATSFEQMLDPATAGKVDEDLGVFGKRIQALLDSQPLIHDNEFALLQRSILKRYASAPRADPDAFELGWLMDDLVRYWRSLCARTRWLSYDKQNTWRALNVKVRHSRMLLCAGLFHLLCEANQTGRTRRGVVTTVEETSTPNKLTRLPEQRCNAWPGLQALTDRLRLVPLERVSQSGQASGIIACYEVFMTAMTGGLTDTVGDPNTFAKLIANGAEMSEAVGTALNNRFGTRVAAALFGELR